MVIASETVAELVAPPVTTDSGTERVPVIVPPAVKVIVKGAFTGSDEIAVMGAVADNVPAPIPPVKFNAVLLSARPLAPSDAVALTVNVVLMVAAGAAAQTKRAKVKTTIARVIEPLRVLHSLMNVESGPVGR